MGYARVLITICGVYLLIIYVPILFIKGYISIEPFNTDQLLSRLRGWHIVSVLGLFGLVLYLWTVFLQVKKGLGTPLPVLPPKKLLVVAPYSYCRNPMVLGLIIFYFGLCAFIGSLDAFFIAASVAVLLVAYVKFWEEGELESRFGQAYIEYKVQTPFLIPRIFGKRWYYLFLR